MNMLYREEDLLANMDRIMRLLRRRPAGKQRLGRGGYRLLHIVARNEGISTRELARRLGVRPSSLNERLVRLEEKEILVRERDEEDQRVFIVRMLPAGDALLDEVSADRRQMLATIGQILTAEEMEMMTELAVKLGDGLEARSRGAGASRAGKGGAQDVDQEEKK